MLEKCPKFCLSLCIQLRPTHMPPEASAEWGKLAGMLPAFHVNGGYRQLSNSAATEQGYPGGESTCFQSTKPRIADGLLEARHVWLLQHYVTNAISQSNQQVVT